jgi:undecaprenyl diphosphate synthase
VIERASVAERFEVEPRHVAIVMDGSDRWASEMRRSPQEGERAGARALGSTARAAARFGIGVLTVHARSEGLARAFALREVTTLRDANVRLQILGPLGRLSETTRLALTAAVESTAGCDGLVLNLTVHYGARAELCDAVRALARDVRAGRLDPAAIDDRGIERYLSTSGLPDPDLVIRTGGELRVSNFLLYQSAYSELWSTEMLWPDFDDRELLRALRGYASRQRRFGS